MPAIASFAIFQFLWVWNDLLVGLTFAGGTVDEPIGRHPTDRLRMAVVEGGKPAVSHYRVVERFAAHTLLRVALETGRTHQIRVHLAHLRWPIVGDPLYGGGFKLPAGASEELRATLRAFKRQALHAETLVFAHPRTGEEWSIYPSYDYAHGQSDAIEGITHSICTLEFEDHRPLYDWVVAQCDTPHRPQQIEFARLNVTFTVMSKRKLLDLVERKLVNGWDDPRLPTLKGLRRRGFTPEALRAFCEAIGVAKRDAIVEMQLLEHFVREDLNKRAPRVMAVLRPLRLVIENYPEGQVEQLDAINNPEDASAGTRQLPFSRVLYIDQEDFKEDPPKQFFRLAPGREVRLRYAYIITCVGVVKDPATGEITELRCTYDPETKSGGTQAQRKVKATIHWVAAAHAVVAEIRLYESLMLTDPGKIPADQDWTQHLNPRSLERLPSCKVEPSLASIAPGTSVQFERVGYFCADPDSAPSKLVFNRTVTLKDAWAKIEKSHAPR